MRRLVWRRYKKTDPYIGFGGIPKSVTLTVILLLSYISNVNTRLQETVIAVMQRMVKIIQEIRKLLETNTSLSTDLKNRYLDNFPSDETDIRQMYLY